MVGFAPAQPTLRFPVSAQSRAPAPNKASRASRARPLLTRRLALVARDAHRNPHATADAQRGKAFLRVAPLHLVEQRDEHAGARGADRMAERDRPAIDVELLGVEAEFLTDRAGLRGKGLIGLDQIEVINRPAGLLESHARG